MFSSYSKTLEKYQVPKRTLGEYTFTWYVNRLREYNTVKIWKQPLKLQL